MPEAHQRLLKQSPIDILETLSKIDDAVDDNADIADAILELALESFGLPENPESGSELDWHNTAQPLDMSKAHSTLRQFWRDWSEEGFNSELRPTLDMIISSLELVRLRDAGESDQAESQDHQSLPAVSSVYPNVLLPGAGLGRLVFELCLRGFNTEGNEISYHQLLSSQFVLNSIERLGQYTLHPFVSSFNNNMNRDRQLHSVSIPDVHPATALMERIQQAADDPQVIPPGQMSMTAGDFITSYSAAESIDSFDAVVTLYFIDTAPNVIRYLETIYHCLRDEGVWINIGPLLWHFEDSTHNDEHDDQEKSKQDKLSAIQNGIAEPGSVELSEDEVIQLAVWLGFELISRSEPTADVGGYIRDSQSLMNTSYKCCHWAFKKRSKD